MLLCGLFPYCRSWLVAELHRATRADIDAPTDNVVGGDAIPPPIMSDTACRWWPLRLYPLLCYRRPDHHHLPHPHTTPPPHAPFTPPRPTAHPPTPLPRPHRQFHSWDSRLDGVMGVAGRRTMTSARRIAWQEGIPHTTLLYVTMPVPAITGGWDGDTFALEYSSLS